MLPVSFSRGGYKRQIGKYVLMRFYFCMSKNPAFGELAKGRRKEAARSQFYLKGHLSFSQHQLKLIIGMQVSLPLLAGGFGAFLPYLYDANSSGKTLSVAAFEELQSG